MNGISAFKIKNGLLNNDRLKLYFINHCISLRFNYIKSGTLDKDPSLTNQKKTVGFKTMDLVCYPETM